MTLDDGPQGHRSRGCFIQCLLYGGTCCTACFGDCVCMQSACVRVSMAMQSPTPHTSSVATRRLAGTDGCGQRYALQLQYAYDMMQQALIDDHERVPRSTSHMMCFVPPAAACAHVFDSVHSCIHVCKWTCTLLCLMCFATTACLLPLLACVLLLMHNAYLCSMLPLQRTHTCTRKSGAVAVAFGGGWQP